MSAKDQGIRCCRSGQQLTPSRAGLLRIAVSAGRPFRMAALDRVMQDIACDHAAIADPEAQVAWCVPRRCLEPNAGGELGVRIHGLDETSVDHRPHGVREGGCVQGIVRARPMVEVSSRQHVPCPGECRSPLPIDPMRVPSNVIDMQVRADDRVDRIRGRTPPP